MQIQDFLINNKNGHRKKPVFSMVSEDGDFSIYNIEERAPQYLVMYRKFNKILVKLDD